MLNKMRNTVLIIMSVIFIFPFFGATGEAEMRKGWKDYQVRDLDMSIFFPDDYLVIYKDMDPNNSILISNGTTPEQINVALGTQYLNAYSNVYNAAYIIQMIASGVPVETEKLTQENLVKECINDFCIEAEKDGSEVLNIVIDNNEFGLYGIIECRQLLELGMARTYTYMSYKNSVLIQVTGFIMEEDYSDEFREEAYQVLDSIQYGNVVGSNEAGIRYEDRIGGVSFLWPAGYYRPYIEEEDAGFIHETFIKGGTNDRIVIQYMCMSMENETHNVLDEIALYRLDTDKMSLTDFMEQVYSYQGPFFEEYHGQHKFFKRYDDSVKMIAVKKGKMYYFMYSGEENDENYSDFIKLVDSVMFADDIE